MGQGGQRDFIHNFYIFIYIFGVFSVIEPESALSREEVAYNRILEGKDVFKKRAHFYLRI